MDQPSFQQHGGDPEDSSFTFADRCEYEWNYTGGSQIATNNPNQAVPLFSPQLCSNPVPHSGLIRRWYAGYAASSSSGQSPGADHQSFPQSLVPWPQPKSATQRPGEPHSNRRQDSGRCVRCWALKKPCKTDGGESRCSQCVKFGLPIQICSRVRLIQHRPFEKWMDETYEILFTTVRSSGSTSQTKVGLRQYPNGPTLGVECYKFLATHQNQTRVLRQNSSGWHPAETTAYCLTNTKIDLSSYVQGCVEIALSEVRALRHPVAFFFRLAWVYKDISIIRQCLEMYTNLRLMRIRWKFAGDENLGMTAIEDKDSAWYGIKPVPRMIQNQLGHLLELNMIDLDRKILKGVQALMEKRERRMWVVVTLSIFLLLHIREVDAGRNIFWSRYVDSLGFWIHPSKPRALIDEATISCNSLLSHFHCTVGRKPLDLNWDDQKSEDMVDNDPNVVKSMKALQAYVLRLSK